MASISGTLGVRGRLARNDSTALLVTITLATGIRAHCSQAEIRRLLLTEVRAVKQCERLQRPPASALPQVVLTSLQMVARCQKNHLNHLLRVATIERKSCIDPWRTTILNFLSILFTGTTKSTEHSSLWGAFISDMRPTIDIEPKNYWSITLKEQISKTFFGDRVFKGAEKCRDYDLRLGIDPVLWIHRLQQLTGSTYLAQQTNGNRRLLTSRASLLQRPPTW